MRSVIIGFVLIYSSVALTASSDTKVVYGEDNRVDVYTSNNNLFVKLASATAAKVSNSKINEYNTTQFILAGKTLADQGICKSEKFSQQPTVARCTGFLVSSNVLVTAGHCARTLKDCTDISWVFDYKVDYAKQSEVIVNKSSVFKCRKILAYSYDENSKSDYAVIELDRKTTSRPSFGYRVKTGKNGPFKGTKLGVIGHPSGLPTKISSGGWIRAIKTNYFTANLDTFTGNSGSPVFDRSSGVVEGIVVRGEKDYVFDTENNCKIVNKVANGFATGEGVTRITIIKNLQQLIATAAKSE